jgi:methyl-accepting chemotaxis protein
VERKRRVRTWLNIRRKIMFANIGVATLVLTVGIIANWYNYHRATAKDELTPMYKRYMNYQRALGQSLSTTVEFVARDDELRKALASGNDDAARPIIARAHDILQKGYHPEILAVVDKHGDVTASRESVVKSEDASEMLVFAHLRQGIAVRDQILFHNDRAYHVAGAPVRNASGEIVGGVLVGVELSRWLADFQTQSDDDAERQLRLAVFDRDSRVAESDSDAMWAHHFEHAWTDTASEQIMGDHTMEVMKRTVDGYDKLTHGPIGKLVLVRIRKQMEELRSEVLRIIFIGGPLAWLFAAVISYILGRRLTRPINQFIDMTSDIASGHGDLTRRFATDSRDELGILAGHLNQLFENLQKLALDVQGASFQVGASSAEISAASKQMLDGAKDQAVKIEGSTAAVTELSASIQTVAANATEATKVASASGDAAQQAIERMAQIRKTVEDAADKIRQLGESVKRVGNIVEVIRQISEQTSLLALNASIEAAHAGEQGRGFAVVADEVSSLARRVGQSAKDIEDLIATIKDQTAEAVRSMEGGTVEVENGTSLVTGTLKNLQQIAHVINDTARQVQEQAVVSDEIARNMDAVQKIAQEVLASSEEAVIQGENLHNLAHQLEQSVRGFKVETPGGGPQLHSVDERPRLSAPKTGRAAHG